MSIRVFAFPGVFFLAFVFAPSANADLIITGVFDGPLDGGEPKVIELYAAADIADLSRYGAGGANNGGGSDGVELVLGGSASKGDFIYIVDDNSDSAPGEEFVDYFGFAPALFFDSSSGIGSGPAAINGDDAVELFLDVTGAFSGGETVIDVFGDINLSGSGTAWDYLDGWAYRIDDTGPDGSVFDAGSWTFSGINANDGKTTNSGPNAFPIGSYSLSYGAGMLPEPSSSLLMLAGVLGLLLLGSRVRGRSGRDRLFTDSAAGRSRCVEIRMVSSGQGSAQSSAICRPLEKLHETPWVEPGR